MNRSRREMGRAGLVSDGGAPRCDGCHARLRFGSDRDGRSMEFCSCGYRGYLKTRAGQGAPPPANRAGGIGT